VLTTVIASVLTLLGIVVANRYTARTARSAQEITATIEQEKLEVQSWKDLNAGLRDEVKRLRDSAKEDRGDLERELELVRQRAEAHSSDCSQKIAEIRTELEEDLHRVKRERMRLALHLDHLVAWGRVIVAHARHNGWEIPAPPPMLADTDPGLTRIED
jgi:septal ring factor EnvC (AmiA/AmiB activator)